MYVLYDWGAAFNGIVRIYDDAGTLDTVAAVEYVCIGDVSIEDLLKVADAAAQSTPGDRREVCHLTKLVGIQHLER